MYTIQDLADGKCAVRNDGTKQQLNRVLKAAFPSDASTAAATSLCYFAASRKGSWWCNDNEKNSKLPLQSVIDFLPIEFSWGENVLAGESKLKGIYVGKDPIFSNSHVIKTNSGLYSFEKIEKDIPKVHITMQQIADKFNIPIESLVIV